MSGRTRLIAGNWKMNGDKSMAMDLIAGIKAHGAPSSDAGGVELLICPPFPLLGLAAEALSGSAVGLGAQSCHANASGAHTGDVSAEMLGDIGCQYVIVGHSERRADHGETDAEVRAQTEAAHRAGLRAIVCVGETEAERDAGRALEIVTGQVAASVPDAANPGNTVIAYEPVWAIGTGRTPTPEDAQEVHAAIRLSLSQRFGATAGDMFRILYGGSMKPGNAASLLSLADVDGGLIGGASLNAEDFLAIANADG